MKSNVNEYEVIVVGAGPAGLTAGIYLSRAKVRTLIVNEGAVGGQLVLTHEVANYPGVESVSGHQLATTMKNQAKSFGCEIRSNVRITAMALEGEVKSVEINGKDRFFAKAVILATGGRSRTLGVPGEETFKGKGISYCATCDGDFFQDKDIIVVGGGNSALEEAVSLTKYARNVTIVHQFDHFQAFPHAIEEARKNPKISFVMQSGVSEFIGDEALQAVNIQNLQTGETTKRSIDGVFIFIGYVPNTEGLADGIALSDAAEIIVTNNRQTTIGGVFAAGDAVQKRYRQITTAVADGTVAALTAIDYLRRQSDTTRSSGPKNELEPLTHENEDRRRRDSIDVSCDAAL